jgi:hypothetical protein
MSERASQHAVMPGGIAIPDHPDGKSTLSVRVHAGMKRRFAVMAAELGVTQQYLIEQWMAGALMDYAQLKASKRAQESAS